MYLMIDNYDSFTYNLYQYLVSESKKEFVVLRNDRVSLNQIEKMAPEGIVISPGPGRSENAGICVDLIQHFAGKIPLLGICLGHQAIGYSFGARIVGARRIVHGKTEQIRLDGRGLFRNLPPVSRFTRYHSLAIDKDTLPPELEVSATAEDGEIMGVRHRNHTIEGIQFHPESIASEHGKKILLNFIHYRREPFDISGYLTRILAGRDLTEQEAVTFMEELTDGELTHSQIAAVFIALNAKKISANEIAGFAHVLNRCKERVSFSGPLLDTCGTGGDETGSFNISSMAALVAVACGATVAKHGNRSVSSRSGSADFYREMGIPVDLAPSEALEMLNKTGFAFLFAPMYHGSMKNAAEVRRELGIKTVMNLLGPLVNPADAEYQLIGVFSKELCRTLAEAAKLLGKKRVITVHSMDGFDEISVSSPTHIIEIDEKGHIKEELFDPGKIGISSFRREELKGGSPEDNAVIAHQILEQDGPPAIREAVLLNAGAALYVSSLTKSIQEGYRGAKEALESGKVRKKVQEIVEVGREILSRRAEGSHGHP
jgi:anthranilate synthase/phosphoribosyltransferase